MWKTPLTLNASSGPSWQPAIQVHVTQIDSPTTNLRQHPKYFKSYLSLARKRRTEIQKKQNPSISVNVLCSGDESGYVPLFLLERPDDTHHYVWTKTYRVWSPTERQLVMQPSSAATVYIHFAQSASTIATSPTVNAIHRRTWSIPIPKERVLEFHNKEARFRLHIYLVCDFESFLTTLDHNEEM